MNFKEMILDFIFFIFLLLIIIFFIFAYINGYFETFSALIKALMPMAVFGIPTFLKLKKIVKLKTTQKKEGKSDVEIAVYLNEFDKTFFEALMFFTPLLVISIAFFIKKADYIDIIQASLVFLVMYFWYSYIFKRKAQ